VVNPESASLAGSTHFGGSLGEAYYGAFIANDQSTSIFVRALGPSLGSLDAEGTLVDPALEWHNSDGQLIASNHDWQDTEEAEFKIPGSLQSSGQKQPSKRH
jgi:hypothetical protein